MEAEAGGGVVRRYNAHGGVELRVWKSLISSSWTPMWRKGRANAPWRGGVKGLGHVKGHDVVFLSTTL